MDNVYDAVAVCVKATVRRRDFITVVGSASASWPLAVRSQQAARVGRVGVLMVLSETDQVAQAQLTAFRNALQEQGRE